MRGIYQIVFLTSRTAFLGDNEFVYDFFDYGEWNRFL